MVTISKAEFNKIGKDYRSTYSDYDGKHPEWKGRRTVKRLFPIMPNGYISKVEVARAISY
jgi:hypothetical protein